MTHQQIIRAKDTTLILFPYHLALLYAVFFNLASILSIPQPAGFLLGLYSKRAFLFSSVVSFTRDSRDTVMDQATKKSILH